MARPGPARRRVSCLVGQFEQLATTNLELEPRHVARGAEEARPRSYDCEISLNGHNVSLFARKASSDVLRETGLAAALADERLRVKDMQEDCEMLQRADRGDDNGKEDVERILERERLFRISCEEQCKYLEERVERIQQRLSSHVQSESAGNNRAEAEVKGLQQQPTLSNSARQEERTKAKLAIQRQHDILAIKLRDAEAREQSALKDARNLEIQLLKLKQSMSASTRTKKQATDHEIAEKLGTLHHEVQNWIVNTFRRVKIGEDAQEMKVRFERLPALTSSTLLRALFDDFDPACKLFALQSTMVHLMMRIFNNQYCFGLPESLQNFCVSAETMKSPSAPYNEWRSQTFLFFQKAQGDVKQEIDAATMEQKQQLMEDVSVVLSALTETELTEHQLTGLSNVIEHAVSLSRLLSVQRAVYTCVMSECESSSRLRFDSKLMEDVLDAEDNGLRDVRCVMFPAVLKAGDEYGDNMSLNNVVFKAKVLCYVDASDDEDG